MVGLAIGAALLAIYGLICACATWVVVKLHRLSRGRTRSLSFLPAIAAILFAYPLLGAAVAMLKGAAAVASEGADPSQKARVLAEGISEFMNSAAFAALLVVPSAIVVFFVSRRVRQVEVSHG